MARRTGILLLAAAALIAGVFLWQSRGVEQLWYSFTPVYIYTTGGSARTVGGHGLSPASQEALEQLAAVESREHGAGYFRLGVKRLALLPGPSHTFVKVSHDEFLDLKRSRR